MTDGDAIRLRARPGEIEIAVVIAGRLVDHALWRPGAPDGLGDLHRGRVTARVGSLGGCFVALENQPDGFLPDRDADMPPTEGTLIAVRIQRVALGGKGPRLTARLPTGNPGQAAAHGDARLVARGPTPLDELVARHPDLETIADTPHLAASCGARLVACGRPDDALQTALAALDDVALDLPGGARATIHPTPALVAIDVDTATATASDRRVPAQTAQFAANRAILPELLHAIRLRNLSGAIVIDLAGLAARKRLALAPEFEAGLALDPLRPRFLGFSALGLAEIVRARHHASLHELRASTHARAIDAGAALARAMVAAPAGGFALLLSPKIAETFSADAVLQADLARETGRGFEIRVDPSLPAPGWRLKELAT